MKHVIKYSCFCLLFLNCITEIYGQTKKEVTSDSLSWRVKFSSNSSLSVVQYTGVRLGVEFPFATKEVRRTTKKGIEKVKLKKQYFTGNISYYSQKNFHTNTYLTVGYLSRNVRQNGFFTEWNPEIGYSRTTPRGTNYEVNEEGEVSKESVSYGHLALVLGIGLGYDFSPKNPSLPLEIFGKLTLGTFYPYNSFPLLKMNLEFGVSYTLSNFTRKVNKKIITKK